LIALAKIASRNRRRAFFTALAISLGFAAVNLFGGFAEYMYSGSREMAVIERTRGIGTLRALGLRRSGVTALFAIESFLLALLGTLGGLILTLSGSWIVDIIKPTWVPPAVTKRVPIMINLSWDQMFFSFIFLIILCLVASLLPARRAARQNVVDALGHV
jgi:putative ABC transport system permease protein